MSDQSAANVTTNAGSDASDKPQKKRAAKKTAYDVRDLARARLRKRGIKTDAGLDRECKVVRGILRSNFALVRKNDAAVRKAKLEANDRRPWPTAMNAHTYDVAVNGKRAKS